jgi:hypothetical protein
MGFLMRERGLAGCQMKPDVGVFPSCFLRGDAIPPLFAYVLPCLVFDTMGRIFSCPAAVLCMGVSSGVAGENGGTEGGIGGSSLSYGTARASFLRGLQWCVQGRVCVLLTGGISAQKVPGVCLRNLGGQRGRHIIAYPGAEFECLSSLRCFASPFLLSPPFQFCLLAACFTARRAVFLFGCRSRPGV